MSVPRLQKTLDGAGIRTGALVQMPSILFWFLVLCFVMNQYHEVQHKLKYSGKMTFLMFFAITFKALQLQKSKQYRLYTSSLAEVALQDVSEIKLI